MNRTRARSSLSSQISAATTITPPTVGRGCWTRLNGTSATTATRTSQPHRGRRVGYVCATWGSTDVPFTPALHAEAIAGGPSPEEEPRDAGVRHPHDAT